MLITSENIESLKRPFVMVDGCFDPLHAGHLKYFEQAKALFNLPILCHIQSDEYIAKIKKRPVLLPQENRAALINGLRPIDYIFVNCSGLSTAEVLSLFKPTFYIKGTDWASKKLPEAELAVCKQFNVEIKFLDTVIDSSTDRVNSLVSKFQDLNFREQVAVFENTVHSQGVLPASCYDESYFLGEWRTNENAYSLEKRREIEAKNPINIKNIFSPKTVLDIGCGPGALMHFLAELDVDVYGLEFSEDAKALASDLVRDRITIGSVTKYLDLGKTFDLVICREVLEHLTVLQIRSAIRSMARYTSKYLYITTRYVQSPKHLLEVGDDKKTDPTHITVLNKEFIRALFVLEGLRSRPDLEDAMDWRKFGRVLVFEKVLDIEAIG